MGRDRSPALPPVVSTPGYLLYKAGFYGQRSFDTSLGAVGLSAREFLALSFIESGDLSQQDLARRMGLDPTIIVGLVDDLEERALVRRERDAADRRRYILAMTTKGHQLLRKATAAAVKAEGAFLDPLDPDERRQLAALLLRLMTPKLPWLHGDSVTSSS